jgi:hypothetical protein
LEAHHDFVKGALEPPVSMVVAGGKVKVYRMTLIAAFVLSAAPPLMNAQSFLIEWSECRLLVVDMKTNRISTTSSDGVDMACATREGADLLVCDYIAGGSSDSKLMGTPSAFGIEERSGGYLFASNETNSTRLHLNLRAGRAILKANYFQPSAPDGFGVKMCVGMVTQNRR